MVSAPLSMVRRAQERQPRGNGLEARRRRRDHCWVKPLSLTDLSFEITDQGEHQGGGHCIGIDRGSPDEWFTVLDQYHRVFEQEVEATQSDDDGWARTRVVIFSLITAVNSS
jgi:hypothetical protein